jgi:hypothetical protein
LTILTFFKKVVDARCDNAGNYKNADLIQGLASISKSTGVLIQTLNTSEPGYGKVDLKCVSMMLIFHLQDFCDRKIAILKSLINEYKMTRMNVTNEKEMKMALGHNGGRFNFCCFHCYNTYLRREGNSCSCGVSG